MKRNKRQLKILEIIKIYEIDKQENIAEKLEEAGIHVTQATVSRDINELGLIKIQLPNKKYKYTLPEQTPDAQAINRFANIFKEAVVSIRTAGNIIVTHTVVGSANSACAFIDKLMIPEILGNLAGDDTIFTVVDKYESVARVVEQLKSYL